MRKKILAFCIAIALAFGASGGLTAFAEVSLEECDRCFQAAVNAFLETDEADGNKVTAERKPVYDLSLNGLGYVYEFEIIGGESYAIIICDGGNYVVQEFVPGAASPYSGVNEDELCVYVGSMTYLKYCEGLYYDIATSAEITPEVLQSLSLNAVTYEQNGYTELELKTVTVTYSSRTTKYKSLAKRMPSYTNPGDLSGACAAIAGTNILGFYDRYYDDLIPNFTAGKEVYGYYIYNADNSYVYESMRELYSDMNGSSAGITESNFKSGMQKYCAKRNLSCDFTSLLSSGKFNFAAAVQSIEENKPIALMLSTYTICDIDGYNGYDEQTYHMYYGNHVMAGFGYCEFDYILTDGSSANYKFIYVSTGFITPDSGYFNISYSTNINSAYKVYIH